MKVLVEIRRRLTAQDERGASLVEYALLIALIALVCIIAVAFLGTSTSESFKSDTNSLFNS